MVYLVYISEEHALYNNMIRTLVQWGTRLMSLRAPDLREYEVKSAFSGLGTEIVQIRAILIVLVHLLLTRVWNASATVRRPRL